MIVRAVFALISNAVLMYYDKKTLQPHSAFWLKNAKVLNRIGKWMFVHTDITNRLGKSLS